MTVANGFPATQQQEVASYTYSPNGRRTSLTDGNGNRAEMMWDGHDRQRRWVFPSPAAPGQANPADYEEYGYDAAGNRTSLRKRDGRTIAFAYDALNRLVARTYPQGGARAVHYGYGLRGEQLHARFDSPAGEGVTNAYDAFGRLASSRIDLGGVARTLAYRYDEAGNRTRITHPDGHHFDYSYDALGRFTGLKENGVSDIASQTYYPTGERFLINRTAAAMGWLYDGAGRPWYQIDDLPNGAGTSWTFARNPAGQITSSTRSNDDYAWTGHYGVTRSYATNGLNQYSATASTTSAGPGSASFSYDANGNLTSDGSRTFAYDIENRLVASGAFMLTYDPLGRLHQAGGGTADVIRYLYDGDELVAEYGASGTMLRRYVHGSGVDEPLFWYETNVVSQDTRRQLLADHQGSIVAIADALGNRMFVNRYDEYGIPAATNTGRFQYTGQIWLPALGLYHYKARFYSPPLGRFMQTDPVGYDDQFNLYAYVGNDPVNRVDPTGQYECTTRRDCDTARTGINQIRQARNYYRSPALGSRVARAAPAARALDKVLGSLGARGDGGVNIRTGDLVGVERGNYDRSTNTITLDTQQIDRSGSRIGEVLGHEVQHYRQRQETMDRFAREVRPLMMQYIIGVVPGGSITGISPRDYVRDRLIRGYCHVQPRFCSPAVERVMDEEFPRPF